MATIELYRLVLRRWQGEASLLDVPDEGPPVDSVERPERFLVRKLGREFLVAANDIEWMQASGNYVNLRMRGHDYPLRSTIAGIEGKLDPDRFVRVHRSYIVNLDQVGFDRTAGHRRRPRPHEGRQQPAVQPDLSRRLAAAGRAGRLTGATPLSMPARCMMATNKEPHA